MTKLPDYVERDMTNKVCADLKAVLVRNLSLVPDDEQRDRMIMNVASFMLGAAAAAAQSMTQRERQIAISFDDAIDIATKALVMLAKERRADHG